MRDQLLPLASLATPNRYELAWLCGAELETNSAIMEAALSLGPSRMLVTSAVPMMEGGTGNLYLSGNHALLAEHRLIDNPPNGIGDLLAALFVARLLDGLERGAGPAAGDRQRLRDPRPHRQARRRRTDA